MSTVFVTGGNGYIGSWISRGLKERGHRVIAGSRMPLSADTRTPGMEICVYGDLREEIDWSEHFAGVDVLVLTAGLVHKREPLSEVDAESASLLNDRLVESISSAAVESGVEHVILMSTVAVNGSGGNNHVVNEDSVVSPDTTYARTKLFGEKKLVSLCRDAETSWTIIRPAMVYGPGCPGNFPSFVRAVRAHIPLPLKKVQNRRSLLYIENLTDMVALCLEKPEARNEIFVVADPTPESMPEIISWIADGLGVRSLMWPFPIETMRRLAALLGVESQLSSLVDDFEIDIQKAKQVLNWQPSFETRNGILRTLRES